MDRASRIYVAGHEGLVGSAIMRRLKSAGYTNVSVRSRAELDLTDQQSVRSFFEMVRPEYVFLAAAKVGGILANSSKPAEFIRDNLMIQTNVIHEAYRHGTRKMLFLGSSCIYPRLAVQPISEGAFLTGDLEPTNKAYAVAKIAGVVMCQAYNYQYNTRFISVMPTNLYGPGDNFDPDSSHVIPGLMVKIHEAKVKGLSRVVVWGTGTPRREFLHVDDLADACLFLMDTYESSELINIGAGQDITISELAELMKEIIGYKGDLQYDPSKPDGPPRKLLDVGKMCGLGWRPKISLREGLASLYRWYQSEVQHTPSSR